MIKATADDIGREVFWIEPVRAIAARQMPRHKKGVVEAVDAARRTVVIGYFHEGKQETARWKDCYWPSDPYLRGL